MDIRQLQKFVRLHDKKRKLEEELKEVKAAISEMQPEVLEYLQENGIQNIDIEGNKIYVSRDIHATFLGTEEAVRILEEQGFADALTTTVHPSRASSIVREIANSIGVDEPLPEWLEEAFSVYDGYKIAVRRA